MKAKRKRKPKPEWVHPADENGGQIFISRAGSKCTYEYWRKTDGKFHLYKVHTLKVHPA